MKRQRLIIANMNVSRQRGIRNRALWWCSWEHLLRPRSPKSSAFDHLGVELLLRSSHLQRDSRYKQTPNEMASLVSDSCFWYYGNGKLPSWKPLISSWDCRLDSHEQKSGGGLARSGRCHLTFGQSLQSSQSLSTVSLLNTDVYVILLRSNVLISF